jgi:anti-sigma regulatory factor (Ser/Thr protein kinase)
VYVDAQLTMSEASYVIGDEGPGFDVSVLPDPEDASALTKASGRGIMLMRTFMDDVRFNETGNEVTLIRHRFAEGARPLATGGVVRAGERE